MVADERHADPPVTELAPSAEQAPTQLRAFTGVAVFAIVTAAIVAGLMGALAAIMYQPLDSAHHPTANIAGFEASISTVGAMWGAATGVLAAMVWCRVMHRRVAAGRMERLTAWGVWTGLLVGVMSTVLLHVGLMVATGMGEGLGLVVGLVFGVPVGAILGAISGALCRPVTGTQAGRS